VLIRQSGFSVAERKGRVKHREPFSRKQASRRFREIGIDLTCRFRETNETKGAGDGST